MTLIVYKKGVMAADSAACIHNDQRSLVVGHVKKVHKSADGWLLGCAGSTYDINIFRDWFLAGHKGQTPRVKNVSALMVSPDGILHMATDEFRMDPFIMPTKQHAFGVGGDFAMGCLAAGASAVETVRLTMLSVPVISGRIHSEVLTGSRQKRIPFIPD